MPPTLVQTRPALAASFCDQKWETKPFQHDSTEDDGLQCKFRCCGASAQDFCTSGSRVRAQVGIVGGTRLSKHDGLPEMVFRSGRREILPTVRPLTWLSLIRTWSCPLTQFHEATMIKHVRRFLQIPQTPSWRFGHVDNLSCELGQSLLEHRQRVRPRCPESWGCQWSSRSEAQTPHAHWQ